MLVVDESNIASYADDTTPYTCNDNLVLVIAKLEEDSPSLIKWINNNHMKANRTNFHLSDNDDSLPVKWVTIGYLIRVLRNC